MSRMMIADGSNLEPRDRRRHRGMATNPPKKREKSGANSMGALRSVIAFGSESAHMRRFRPKFASGASCRAPKYNRYVITDRHSRNRKSRPLGSQTTGLLSRGSQVRVLSGAPIWQRIRESADSHYRVWRHSTSHRDRSEPTKFCYDRARGEFLATANTQFVRSVITGEPSEPIVPRPGPLRILLAATQPIGLGRLSVEQEGEILRRGFEPLVNEGLATVDLLPRATPTLLHEQLATGQHNVLHFVGACAFDHVKNESALLFESNTGVAFSIGERTLLAMLISHGLDLLFFSAYQGASRGPSEFNHGLAQSLLARGIPALVANQYGVLDASATSFAQQFYRLLGQGLSIGDSRQGRRGQQGSGLPVGKRKAKTLASVLATDSDWAGSPQ
jgi:CHAT domain